MTAAIHVQSTESLVAYVGNTTVVWFPALATAIQIFDFEFDNGSEPYVVHVTEGALWSSL